VRKSELVEPKPLLRPEHFTGLSTGFGENGLGLKRDISQEREMLACAVKNSTRVFKKIEKLRPHTRIVSNPSKDSAGHLRRVFKKAQRASFQKEHVNVSWGLSNKSYDREWHCGPSGFSDDCLREGQQLVLVAYAQDAQPVGYAGLNFELLHDRAQRELQLSCEVSMVYVMPLYRGQGFGLDLSVAGDLLCEGLLKAVYRSVPARTTIVPIITADYISKGGERFCRQVVAAFEAATDGLLYENRRPSVDVERVTLDAGY
jgi:GNAT superfamily N-acetyltransferase